MTTIGFIGTGELALYTIRGWRRGGYRGRIILSPRNREIARRLQNECDCEVLGDNQAVAAASDYLFIATRPPDCLAALAELELRPDQVLVSVVAGIEIAELRTVLPADLEILRVMPVSSAEAGASPTLVYPGNEFVKSLFDYCGQAIGVDDEAIFSQGSVLACVYSWFFELYDKLIDATEGPALPQPLARELVMGMAAGAARLALLRDDMSPGEIAEGIATEGTYSKLGLDLLRDEKAFDAWREACLLLQRRLAADD